MLSEQTIGILVRRALPGTVRVGKIDANPRPMFKLLMAGHFPPLVVGQDLSKRLGQRPESPREALQNGCGRCVLDLGQDHESAAAIHQGTD